jgi:dimethylamine monooxygenase subunit A
MISETDATGVLPDRIRSFPFPFPEDTYRYSTNVEPAHKPVGTEGGEWGSKLLCIDEHYLHEVALREEILEADPTRLQVLDHMKPAVWDAITTLLPVLAAENPEAMDFSRDGRSCRWINRLQGLDLQFTAGDDASLPVEPLRFLGSQVQDDIVLLDQRENALWLDAGLVTFAADWSMGFDVGMSFLEVHGPVPRVHEEQVITRAQQFLMRLQPGERYRRTNWTMTVDRRLDTSTETYPDWGQDRALVAADPRLPERLHLRVEVQHLVRLPHSGALLFLVRTHLLPLTDIARVPAWRHRLGSVLQELPADMADYKGLTRYRDAAVEWLLQS